MKSFRTMILSCALIAVTPLAAKDAPEAQFQFQSVASLEEMRSYISQSLVLGTSIEQMRKIFVHDGMARLIPHPNKTNVEKYIYDINLCQYYIWRWNISADYDSEGLTEQVYVNGEPVFPSGKLEIFDPQSKAEGTKSKILMMNRPRPRASKGENSLSFILYDLDGDLETINDQRLIGGGPTRPDPLDMGTIHTYNVDPWRSIFDLDDASEIVDHHSDCASVDAAMEQQRRQ